LKIYLPTHTQSLDLLLVGFNCGSELRDVWDWLRVIQFSEKFQDSSSRIFLFDDETKSLQQFYLICGRGLVKLGFEDFHLGGTRWGRFFVYRIDVNIHRILITVLIEL
jgi:hypothetical protein